MIKREIEKTLKQLAKSYPVLAITGPRQSGKTTVVKKLFPKKKYLNLEDLSLLEHATDDPKDFLLHHKNGAIIDEVQRCPQLFSYIQIMVDEQKIMGQFILTGSQQFGLMEKITQSLAGRVGIIDLLPFSQEELKKADLLLSLDEQLLKGGYPVLYDRNITINDWFTDYVRTYIERDVRNILKIEKLSHFQRFIKLCAARSGQIINYSSLANDANIDQRTVKSWLSILEASYIIYQLPPHHRNFSKRIIKQPKLYFHDTGLAAFLLGINNAEQLNIHSNRGHLFETYIIGELKKMLLHRRDNSTLSFWRNQQEKEIDLIIENGTTTTAIEVKISSTIQSDFFLNLNYFRKINSELNNSFLIYGGNETGNRNSHKIIPWSNCHILIKPNK